MIIVFKKKKSLNYCTFKMNPVIWAFIIFKYTQNALKIKLLKTFLNKKKKPNRKKIGKV